jgi:hypothetical protein
MLWDTLSDVLREEGGNAQRAEPETQRQKEQKQSGGV